MKKGGSLSSIRRAGSLKSTKMSRQDSESENDAESDRLLSQSRDTVTDIGEKDFLMSLSTLYTELHSANDMTKYKLILILL